MRPVYRLDLDIVARNAEAWAAYAGVPVRAVLKCDGYDWGAPRLARALAAHCEAFCVADADEFASLRPHATLPIVVLGSIGPERLGEVLDGGGVPTIGTREELAICSEWAAARERALSVRVGVVPAAGWSGLDLEALAAFAPALADEDVEVELWTHLTDERRAPEQLARLQEAAALLRRAGVNVARIESAATFATAQKSADGESARIGIGLFGATGGTRVPGVRCAIALSAPVLRVERFPAGSFAGYGTTPLPEATRIATVRCGYGDGYPRETGERVLAVGMQYALMRARDEEGGASTPMLGPETDLDALAARAGRSVHEMVTAMGSAARVSETR